MGGVYKVGSVSQLSGLTGSRAYVRHEVKDLSAFDRGTDSRVEEALGYFHRATDHDVVKDKLIERYALFLVKEVDEISGAVTEDWAQADRQVSRINVAQKTAILNGQQEILTTATYSLIVAQQATLFNSNISRFSYEDNAVEEEISAIREEAQSDLSVIQWDSLACAVGSGALYLSLSNGRLSEQPISPSRVWVCHAPEITSEDGVESTDSSDIDQASVVVVRFDGSDGSKNKYCAWFGPSGDYPDGRCVVYWATKWYEIPQPGSKEALEYVISDRWVRSAPKDVLANPLTLISDELGELIPVYPIVLLTGDPMRRGLLPLSFSLYENCVELSVMNSILLGCAGVSAKGIQALAKGDNATSVLPKTIREGQVILGRGLSLAQQGWEAINVQQADAVYKAKLRQTIEDNHVAEFLISRASSGEIPSGVALQQVIQPMKDFRNLRAAAARSSVARRWMIEKALTTSAGVTAISIDSVEQWHPGDYHVPVDRAALVNEWAIRVDKQFGDLADAIQEIEQLDTREKAINRLEQMEKDKELHPVLAGKKQEETTQPAFGGLRGLSAGRQIPSRKTEA